MPQGIQVLPDRQEVRAQSVLPDQQDYPVHLVHQVQLVKKEIKGVAEPQEQAVIRGRTEWRDQADIQEQQVLPVQPERRDNQVPVVLQDQQELQVLSDLQARAG